VKATTHITTNHEATIQYVDARFLAKKYDVSARQIYLLAARKKIPSTRLGAKCIRFNESEIAKALEENGGDV